MKVGTLASLLSLAAIVASAAVPQTPLALGNISNDTRPSAPLRYTPFGFVLPHRHEIAQCARTEIRWENGTPPYRLSIAFGPKDGDLVQSYEVYGLKSHSYPLVVCGPSYGTLQAKISDSENIRSELWHTIMPSSDSRCLD